MAQAAVHALQLPISVGRVPGRMLVRRAVAGAWLGLAVIAGAGEPVVLLIILALIASEILAPTDELGVVGLSGFLVPLALFVAGPFPAILLGIGGVIVGDVFVRRSPWTRSAWHLALLALMFSAGAWLAGGAELASAPATVMRAIALVWLVIQGAWLIIATRRRGHLEPMILLQGFGMSALTAGALVQLVWIELTGRADVWIGAAFTGMAFASGFMLVDLVLASMAALRASGVYALRFWLDHMPVLFARYVGQAAAAAVTAYAFQLYGSWAVAFALMLGMLLLLGYRLHRKSEELLSATISALTSAIDARDSYTAGHSERVSKYASRVGKSLGWSRKKIHRTEVAGLLHDIGKVGIRDDVLFKSGQLSEDEFEHMKQHAEIGEGIVAKVSLLHDVAVIVGQDHERWDGTGYPRRLAGEAIRDEARLIALADVFDALTTDRPYRSAWTAERTLSYIADQSGSHFDPTMSEAFTRAARRPSRVDGVDFCYCATH